MLPPLPSANRLLSVSLSDDWLGRYPAADSLRLAETVKSPPYVSVPPNRSLNCSPLLSSESSTQMQVVTVLPFRKVVFWESRRSPSRRDTWVPPYFSSTSRLIFRPGMADTEVGMLKVTSTVSFSSLRISTVTSGVGRRLESSPSAIPPP